MANKKNLIKQAILDARELERTAEENARNALVETFEPNLSKFFESVLETDEIDDEEYDDTEDDVDEGTEHDIGKMPGKLARDSGAEKEEPEINEDWEADQSTGANRAVKVSKQDGWDKVHTGNYGTDPGKGETLDGEQVANKTGGGATPAATQDPGKGETLDGEQVANKTGGGATPTHPGDPGGSEEKLSGKLSGRTSLTEDDDEEEFEDDEDLPFDIEDDEDVFDEAEGDEDDEELEIPDELFQDEEDDEVSDSPDEEDDGPELEVDDPLSDEEDDEIDFDLEDDLEDDGDDEPLDDEEMEEGLYLKKEGRFVKVSPAEALQSRISELEEENGKLQGALGALSGQLRESHLFNAKLAHVNKLYISGLFSAKEKLDIAKRIDECNSVKSVKTEYVEIVSEVKSRNPLDDFSNVISEARQGRNVKKENVFESDETRRMISLAGLHD